MKDKFLKFGWVLLFMAMFLNSCHDDFNDENLKESSIKLETVTLEDILQKPKHNKFRKTFTEFKETYTTLGRKEGRNILGKFVYNEEFGFYIDDSNGRYIEKDGHHSYTFRIIRLESDDKVENIVFNYKSDGEYYITLAKYDITDDALKEMPLEQIPSIGTEHYRWNADGIELICIDFTTYITAYNHSCQETHSNGYTCSPEVISYTSTFCSWTNGGGGGGSSSGDSGSGTSTGGISGGGGSNGSSNSPSSPLITTPVGMDGIKIEQHILQLNKITDQNESGTNVLRNYIDQLYEELDNPLIEQGMEFKANLDGSYSAYPAQSAQYSGVRFFPVNVNNPLIRIHKHHTQLNPVFSAEDILGMMEFFMQKYNLNPSSAENSNISFIMVSETGVHALRVTSPSEAQQFNSYYSSPSGAQAFIDAYNDKVIKKSQDECGGTCSDEEYKNLLMQNFIAFFKEFVWGFAYYYAPHPANPTDNYNWTLQN